MRDLLTKTGCPVDAISGEQLLTPGTESLQYGQLFDRYAKSPFGEFHAEQPLRYANRYSYEREAMLADLGDDVHPIKHMQFTEASIAVPLMVLQNSPNSQTDEVFDNDEVTSGRFGAMLHDIGECQHPDLEKLFGTTVGDVNYHEKTAEHEAQEVVIRGFFYEKLYFDVPQHVVMRAETMIANNKGSFLSEAFRAVENIGYLVTIAQAGRLACRLVNTPAQESKRFEQLKRLATNDLTSSYERVEKDATRFPYSGVIATRQQVVLQNFERRFG